MPLDTAAGCVGLIVRVLLDILSPGVAEWIWWWLRAVGAFVVFVLTFGQVNLMERHETLAGVLGILIHVAVAALCIWLVVAQWSAT